VDNAIIVGFAFIANAVRGIAGVVPRIGLHYPFFLRVSAVDAIIRIKLLMFGAII